MVHSLRLGLILPWTTPKEVLDPDPDFVQETSLKQVRSGVLSAKN